MLQGIIQYAHQLLKNTAKPGDLVVDATCGNGNDTVFLSELAGDKGKVLAFDVQAQAIETTKTKLKELQLTNVQLIHKGHEFVSDYVKSNEEISAGIFNLGYLPKSDKKIITESDTTLKALQDMLRLLKKKGIIVLVVYHGHEGGATEKNALLEYVKQLEQKEYHVLNYGFINQKNTPPFIIAIEKR